MDRLSKRSRCSDLVSRWHSSGQSKAAFCRAHDLSECQFHYWCNRLREDADTDRQSGFAQVTVCRGSSGVRLRIGGGLEVELDADFDCGTLKRLISTLRSPC